MVKRCTYSLDSRDIRAYCVPAYVEEVKEVIEEEEEMKRYENGSTTEPVYADTNCTNKIGSLNPWEKCDCFGIFENRAMVRYKVDNQNNYKIGFCKWLSGVK